MSNKITLKFVVCRTLDGTGPKSYEWMGINGNDSLSGKGTLEEVALAVNEEVDRLAEIKGRSSPTGIVNLRIVFVPEESGISGQVNGAQLMRSPLTGKEQETFFRVYQSKATAKA